MPSRRRILVRATNWVGDAVMSLPALHALRTQFPESHIAVLARPAVADLYRSEPVADEVIPYNAPKGWRGFGGQWRVARALREKRFDCAVLFQNAFEAAALVFAARIPERIGYARDGRSFLLTKAVRVPRTGEIPVHQRFYYFELLRRAGLIAGYPSTAEAVLSGRGEAARRGRELMAGRGVKGPVIGVSPGAAFGGAKRWLPERFAESSSELAKRLGGSVAVFGTAAEQDLAEQVAGEVRERGIDALNWAGKTSLAEYIDLAAACELFLTNDSGSMHIASALGVPTVVVFGPTDETATGPAGHAHAILREPVECAPCHLRECPIDHRCMTRVPASRAVEAATTLLKQVS